jgi:hypothetical protein
MLPMLIPDFDCNDSALLGDACNKFLQLAAPFVDPNFQLEDFVATETNGLITCGRGHPFCIPFSTPFVDSNNQTHYLCHTCLTRSSASKEQVETQLPVISRTQLTNTTLMRDFFPMTPKLTMEARNYLGAFTEDADMGWRLSKTLTPNVLNNVAPNLAEIMKNPDSCLSDMVMDFVIETINAHCMYLDLPMYFVKSMVVPELFNMKIDPMTSNWVLRNDRPAEDIQESITKNIKDFDPAKHKFLFLPILCNSHWTMFKLELPNKLTFYDSYCNMDGLCQNRHAHKLISLARLMSVMLDRKITLQYMPKDNNIQQTNVTSCGFMVLYHMFRHLIPGFELPNNDTIISTMIIIIYFICNFRVFPFERRIVH